MEKKINQIKQLLANYPKEKVEKFCVYLIALSNEKKKDKATNQYVDANPFVNQKEAAWLANQFVKLDAQGLEFDGKHITLQSRGISLDYIAMKNKLLEVYPEAKIFYSAVRAGDEFSFEQQNGVVKYSHKIGNPFNKGKLQGVYCVLKCSRGEYITVLDNKEIEKHAKKAQAANIWSEWNEEMALKTVIRKACRIMLDDAVGGVDLIDEAGAIDFEAEISEQSKEQLEFETELEKQTTIEGLREFYLKNKPKTAGNAALFTVKSQKVSKNFNEKLEACKTVDEVDNFRLSLYSVNEPSEATKIQFDKKIKELENANS